MGSTTDKTRKMLEAATPGPWEPGKNSSTTIPLLVRRGDLSPRIAAIYGNPDAKMPVANFYCEPRKDNAALIAHARKVLPAYVRVAEAAARLLDAVESSRVAWVFDSEDALRDALSALDSLEDT